MDIHSARKAVLDNSIGSFIFGLVVSGIYAVFFNSGGFIQKLLIILGLSVLYTLLKAYSEYKKYLTRGDVIKQGGFSSVDNLIVQEFGIVHLLLLIGLMGVIFVVVFLNVILLS